MVELLKACWDGNISESPERLAPKIEPRWNCPLRRIGMRIVG